MARETKLDKFAKDAVVLVKNKWKKSVRDYVIVKEKKNYKLMYCNRYSFDTPDNTVAYLAGYNN